jgi:hypothetical protein
MTWRGVGWQDPGSIATINCARLALPEDHPVRLKTRARQQSVGGDTSRECVHILSFALLLHRFFVWGTRSFFVHHALHDPG